MTDHNLPTSENKSSICSITNVQGYTLLVFKDSHGYFVDAIAPNGEPERGVRWGIAIALREIFHSAASAEAKGRQWTIGS